MSKKIEIPRRYIRYNNPEITVYICKKGKVFDCVELLNISQQGLAFKTETGMRLKKHLDLTIKFNEGEAFELKGHIVSKSNNEIKRRTQFMEMIWELFVSDYSFYNYGISFNEVSDDFKLFLLKSNMQKKLSNLSQTKHLENALFIN